MSLLVKKASALTSEEKSSLGLTGIPDGWPIESYPYSGEVPVGFEEMTEVEFLALKTSNQEAYEAWAASKIEEQTEPRGETLVASFFSDLDAVDNRFLISETDPSNIQPAVSFVRGTLSLLTFSSVSSAPQGTIEIRINTTTGTPAASVALEGTSAQVTRLDVQVAQGDSINCKVASGASNVDRPVVKLYSGV